MITFFALLAGFMVVFIVFVTLYCMCGPVDSYKPMPFDEEVEWLMKDHNMTKEEAEEIASL